LHPSLDPYAAFRPRAGKTAEHYGQIGVNPRQSQYKRIYTQKIAVAEAKQGDAVQVHYTGKLEDGTVFDTSQDREPLEFTIGEDRVIPGFESAVLGMEPGDSKTQELGPDDAYGQRREDMVMELDRGQIPEDLDPEVGQQLHLRMEDGQRVPVVITKLGEESVTIDANHPLAGKKLIFDIELISIGEDGEDEGGNIITP
jgi:FKBP-type peptidyl-prolyl cis-trans isomerase 2